MNFIYLLSLVMCVGFALRALAKPNTYPYRDLDEGLLYFILFFGWIPLVNTLVAFLIIAWLIDRDVNK